LRWYPPDVERYVLAAAWERVAQRMPMVGRTAQTGQDRQSRVLCARLVDDLTALALLLHRRWAPYDQGRGGPVHPPAAPPPAAPPRPGAPGRGGGGAPAAPVDRLPPRQRDRGLPTPDEGVTPFWSRPYRTVSADVPTALLTGLDDPVIRALPPYLGGV